MKKNEKIEKFNLKIEELKEIIDLTLNSKEKKYVKFKILSDANFSNWEIAQIFNTSQGHVVNGLKNFDKKLLLK